MVYEVILNNGTRWTIETDKPLPGLIGRSGVSPLVAGSGSAESAWMIDARAIVAWRKVP